MTAAALWIVPLALVVSALTGWPLVSLVLRLSAGFKRRGGSGRGSAREEGTDDRAASELLRGGLWIGLLERVAVTGAVMLGEYAIVAAVVAVKGLGRFKELSTPEASERFVVGTLASLTWAGLIGVAGLGLIRLFS